MNWLSIIPSRLIAYALALAFAFGGWWMYARTVRAWDREKAVAEGQADLAREMNRGRAKDAVAEFKARPRVITRTVKEYLHVPIPCASAPTLADVVIPAAAVGVLRDASKGAD